MAQSKVLPQRGQRALRQERVTDGFIAGGAQRARDIGRTIMTRLIRSGAVVHSANAQPSRKRVKLAVRPVPQACAGAVCQLARRSLEPLLKTLLQRASPVQFALF
ncbi:hypothetical protein LJ655_08600 [Paraburkholderia sp. MMS20-SJTN17]|uniref:Uncharacterized protein n=1 Tax=Paraburkholderia translucens TaxID=2886945 RepID=A0ABS8KB11_9BURK|nr:hypothetical protein [Paraburkholderia sp. MMS20-SJTN17]MCC8401951.1 hypothetical protein [Paraburkholderia sp. MMS20-SJTN17]